MISRRALLSSAALLAAALWFAFRASARRRDRERLYARLDAVVERRAA